MSAINSSLQPAIIKCYNDASCTEEIEKENLIYRITLGPSEGFNGTDGEQTSQYIYLKNCGDTAATEVYIKEVGDKKSYFKMSAEKILLADTILEIGTILPSHIIPVKISSFIPAESAASSSYINYTIIYNTIPPFNESYYIDALGEDELALKRSITKASGAIQEEYTIRNISPYTPYTTIYRAQMSNSKYLNDSLERGIYLVSSSIFKTAMRTPVKIYHGAKDEIYYDTEENKYKVRLKCPNCEKWTDWYDLNTFDYDTTLVCTHCSGNIKVANNVDFSINPTSVENLAKYRIAFTEKDWTLNEETNQYYLLNSSIANAICIGVYRKNNSQIIKTEVNITAIGESILLENPFKFSGYIILVSPLSRSEYKSKTGQAYGKGKYGKELYGQEGLIHITDNIEIDLPIKGQDTVMINADYSILTKYTGNEENIEDIQSYYTYRYMMLGCYDGPALPLKLSKIEL